MGMEPGLSQLLSNIQVLQVSPVSTAFAPKRQRFLAPCFPSPLITCRQALGCRSSRSLRKKIPIQKALLGGWSLNPPILSLCSGGGVHWLVEQIFCLCRGEWKVRLLPGEGFWHTEGKTSPSVSPVVRFRDEKRAVTLGHQGCCHESESNEGSPYVRAWIWNEKSLWTTVNEKVLWESVDNIEMLAVARVLWSVGQHVGGPGFDPRYQRMKDKWNQPARWLGVKLLSTETDSPNLILWWSLCVCVPWHEYMSVCTHAKWIINIKMPRKKMLKHL